MGNHPGSFIYRLKHRKSRKTNSIKIVQPIELTAENKNLETFLLVWLDPNVDSSDENIQTQNHLRKILTCLITFDRVKSCEDWLKSCIDEKIILIVSGAYGEEIVPKIHDIPSIIAIYIYCLDVDRNKIWAKDYRKIRSVQSSTNILLKELSQNQHRLENVEDLKALQIYQLKEHIYSLDIKTASLIWYQLLLEILITPSYLPTSATHQELIRIFQQYNFDDQYGSQLIDQFQRTYQSTEAILWLIRDTLFGRSVNKALREQDINMIFALRFLLIDIHKQLIEHQAPSLNLFKIQLMSTIQMENIRANPGQLVVIHGFLFATTNRSLLMSTITNNDLYEAVLFDIQADYRPGVAPFAYLHHINSKFEEQIEREVLFMCGSIFEVGSLEYNNSIWILRLKLVSQFDIPILSNIKQKLKDNRQLNIIGNLLRQCNENDKADQFFQRLNYELTQENTDILLRQQKRKINTKLTLDPIENISFILINLNEYMTEFTSSILNILNSYVSKFILNINEQSRIDFSLWSMQSAIIYTTTQTLSSLDNIPKHFKLRLLDISNTDVEQPRFTTIDDLISRFVDEVIEKYRMLDDENMKSITCSNINVINKKINRIYFELEQIHLKYHSKSLTMNCSMPILICLISNQENINELSSIEIEFKDYFSSIRLFFNENKCQECLAMENTIDAFLIIYGFLKESIRDYLRQFSHVKYFYYYEKSKEMNQDDLHYRLAYDLLEYYRNLGEQCQANGQIKKAREIFIKSQNLCRLLSRFFQYE